MIIFLSISFLSQSSIINNEFLVVSGGRGTGYFSYICNYINNTIGLDKYKIECKIVIIFLSISFLSQTSIISNQFLVVSGGSGTGYFTCICSYINNTIGLDKYKNEQKIVIIF